MVRLKRSRGWRGSEGMLMSLLQEEPAVPGRRPPRPRASRSEAQSGGPGDVPVDDHGELPVVGEVPGCYTSRSGPLRDSAVYRPDAGGRPRQGFFLKLYERDFLANRPAITGRFRNWLYVAARRHAIDGGGRTIAGPGPRAAAGDSMPPTGARRDPDDAPFDADELYATQHPPHDDRAGAQASDRGR